MNYRTGQDEAAIAGALSIGLFLKANGSLSAAERRHRAAHDGAADRPRSGAWRRHWQAGREHRREDALKHVAGYAVALDITPHGKEERSLRKSCETYSVIGPWLVTADEIPDPEIWSCSSTSTASVRQQGNTKQMIRDVAALIDTPRPSTRCTRVDDMALSRGFMTANSSMNVNGENTNQNVSAEALMMLKEHIIESYGPIRYTIGQGCSGGSYQYMVARHVPRVC